MSHYQMSRIIIQHFRLRCRIPHFRKYDEEINTYSLKRTSEGKIYILQTETSKQSQASMFCNKLGTIN